MLAERRTMRMISQRDTSQRWWMLVILSLGFIELTLNWFDIAATFPALAPQFRLGIPQLSLLISIFFVGYGVFHIPTGFLSYRFGLRNTLLLGLLVESLGAIATAFAPSYGWLVALRFVTGIGASFFVGCGFALTTSWFRGRELALALGIAGGGAFAVGTVLGLSTWISIVLATSWSTALIIGGASGLVVFIISLLFLRVPNEERAQLTEHRFSWASVGRVLGNRDLWLLGLGLLGAYGAGLTTDQLLSTYVGIVYHLPPEVGGLMAAVLTLIGIPGSVVGGYLADRARSLKPIMITPWIIMGLCLIAFPFVNLTGAWIIVIIEGSFLLVGFAAWSAAPGHYKDRVLPEDVATASGLMLTLAAVGGFLAPIGFGLIAGSSGFTGAWIFLGVISIVFAFVALAAREPLSVSTPEKEKQAVTSAM